jgi:hypothetical protein
MCVWSGKRPDRLEVLLHGQPITSLTISETAGTSLSGLSVRVIDESGEVWDNSEGSIVGVVGSWEGNPAMQNRGRRPNRVALTQSQATEQLRGPKSTLDALAELSLPEIIDLDSNGDAVLLEFSVTCTIDAPLKELCLEGDFNVKLVPAVAERWHILLNEAGEDRRFRFNSSLTVRCDDEEDLVSIIRGKCFSP